jgi:serine/threonine protein kinase
MEAYSRIRLLGEGSFGKCYLVRDLRDQSICVIKCISLRGLQAQELEEVEREAKIMERLKHPSIVGFREKFQISKHELCIAMEYAEGGDLQARIKAQRAKYFAESQVLDWFVQLCLAVKHLHDRKVLHRDLKTQNIFLTSNGRVKLGDFGISRVLRSTLDSARTLVGTPYYLSPEIVESKPYSFKSDIWALGVILYEIASLKPPFDEVSLHRLAVKIVAGSYDPLPSHYSAELKLLVGKILCRNPADRPTINEILELPLIKSRISQFLSESVRAREFSHSILHNHYFFSDAPKQLIDRPLMNSPKPPQSTGDECCFDMSCGSMDTSQLESFCLDEVAVAHFTTESTAAIGTEPPLSEDTKEVCGIFKSDLASCNLMDQSWNSEDAALSAELETVLHGSKVQSETMGYSKIESLRIYLEEYLGDMFIDVYAVVKPIYSAHPGCGFEAYYEGLSVYLDRKSQEQVLPTLCVLLYMEECFESEAPVDISFD